jgi:integrase
LTWSDIQHTNGQYFVHIVQKKTKEIIVHPLSDLAVKVLGEQGDLSERVFGGLDYSDRNNDKLRAWVLDAGITKKITLHNFRHTYATLLLNNGADIFTVSSMLGHKNIKTTMIYTKVLDSTKIKAANSIDVKL